MSVRSRTALAAFMLLLVFGCSSFVCSQKKPTVGVEKISMADPDALTESLKKLLERYTRPGMSDEEVQNALKGKLISGSLTTDSYLGFSPGPARYISGIDARREGVSFAGYAYRLVPEGEFPAPRPVGYGRGMGTGPAVPRLNSREELLSDYVAQTPAQVWPGSVIRLYTDIDEASRPPRPIKGTQWSADNPQGWVPSPQTHYELAFTTVQPGRLKKIEDDDVFSISTYDYTTVTGPGFVAWLPDKGPGEPFRETDVVFIVKLVPPYFESVKLSRNDPIAEKPHIVVRNKIYVDIVDVWVCDRITGEVLLRNALDPTRSPNQKAPDTSKLALVPPDRALSLLAKPVPGYTDAARQHNVEGIVTLRVTFLSNGQIGAITPVKELPFGLTEQAVNAARRIKFQPARRGGVPVSVVKVVQYNFSTY